MSVLDRHADCLGGDVPNPLDRVHTSEVGDLGMFADVNHDGRKALATGRQGGSAVENRKQGSGAHGGTLPTTSRLVIAQGEWLTCGVLTELEAHADARDPEPFAGPDHPIRVLTRAVAFGKEWKPEHAERMSNLFNELAPDWSSDHVDDTKAAPVRDALDRGDVPIDGAWLEVGSGTGAGARVLDGVVGSLVCTDLSAGMLSFAPDLAPRAQSDASALPFDEKSFDAVLLINMLLFPGEIDRVLRPGGTVVWVNTLGDQTPIHLPAEDVLEALPGSWQGTTARAGTGFWLAARRA